MSLLLDALKKSEAQRRRGRAPSVDLSSIPERPESPPPRRRWQWLLLPVAVIAVGIWQWPAIERLVTPQDGAQALAPAGGLDPASATAAPTADALGPNGVAQTPPAAPDRPEPSAGQAAGDDPAPSAGAAIEARRPDDSSPALPNTSARPSRSIETGAPRPGTVEPTGPAASPTERSAGPQPASSAPDPQPAPGPEARSQADESLDGAILPWELPQARRAEFPELDLTVHYFAAEPGERFVLINGERYRQGDRLEGGVRVREIVQRGVLLEFGSYLVLLE